jgi:hypothetical protein
MRRSLLLSLLVAFPGVVHGQSILRDAGRDIRTSAGDILFVYASPARADTKDWLAAGGVIAATGLISLADDDLDRWVVRRDEADAFEFMEFFRERRDPSDIEWSDIGTARILSKISLGLWATGLVTRSEDLRDAGMGCLSTWLAIEGARQVNYVTWSRRRPSDSPSGDQYMIRAGHGSWADRSFISGHFANPIGCAKFWSDRFELGALEPAMYAVSLAVGWSRMVDRRHWLSDIAISGALGYVAGKTVARRQNERRR